MTIDSVQSSPEKSGTSTPARKAGTGPPASSSFPFDLPFSPIRKSRRVVSRRVVNLGVRHSPRTTTTASSRIPTAATESIESKGHENQDDAVDLEESDDTEAGSMPISPLHRRGSSATTTHSSSSSLSSRPVRAGRNLSSMTTDSSVLPSTSLNHRRRSGAPGQWARHLSFQKDYDFEHDTAAKKSLRRSLPEDLDEDNPFLVTPVSSRKKSQNNQQQDHKDNGRRSPESVVQVSSSKIMPAHDETKVGLPPRTGSGAEESDLTAHVSKQDVSGSMAALGEEGKEEEISLRDRNGNEDEEDHIFKHLTMPADRLIGSPTFKALKRGIQPEARLPDHDDIFEDDEGSDSSTRRKDEILLRTPQKKRRSQQFLSPGSPGDWLELQSPTMRRSSNIPYVDDHDEEGTESPSPSTSKVSTLGRLETPVRNRVYAVNDLDSQGYSGSESVSGEEKDEEEDIRKAKVKGEGPGRTKKRHAPASMNLDLSNLAMLPPTISARAWSSNNNVTPTSSRRVIYDVFQTPPPKSRPVPSPEMKPPPAPSFSPFKAHPMYFNDRSDRYSPARQKSARLQQLNLKQDQNSRDGAYFD